MGQNLDNLFFAKIRAALGHDPARQRSWNDLRTLHQPVKTGAQPDRNERLKLLDTLKERSKINETSITVVPDVAAAAMVVAESIKKNLPEEGAPAHVVAWRHEVIDSLDLETVLATVTPQITVYPAGGKDLLEGESERQQAKDLAATAICGVTSADWCLADSATLVMRTRAGQGRAVSLLPPIHIAVVPLSSLIAGLGDLYASLGKDKMASQHGLTNCMTFVSGRSTTRDIESVAVPGAHGPEAVHIVMIS